MGTVTPTDAPPLSRIGRLLARVGELLERALSIEVHEEPAAALLEVPALAEQVTRQLEAVKANVLPVIDDGGLWALDGQRSFAAWTAARTGVSYTHARRDVKRARTLRDHLPATAKAWREAKVGVDHVDALVAHAVTSPQRIEALSHPEVGEGFLVEVACQTTPKEFTTVVRSWAVMVDPEAAERAYVEATSEQRVGLAQTMGGWHLEGWLTHESGLTLRTALDAITGRPAKDDTRSRSQRDAAALTTMARKTLDAGEHGKSARVRPHILVHVPVETLAAMGQTTANGAAFGIAPAATSAGLPQTSTINAGAHEKTESAEEANRRAGTPARKALPASHVTSAGHVIPAGSVIPAGPLPEQLRGLKPATFADGEPLTIAQLSRYLCDATLTRVVFGADGQPLDVGRAKRVFTEAQTKAVIARDGHCQYPGCSAPPTWCEVHHATPWSHGGATSVDNAILLCWTHHNELHKLHLDIQASPDRWRFLRPGGFEHGTTPRKPSSAWIPRRLL